MMYKPEYLELIHNYGKLYMFLDDMDVIMMNYIFSDDKVARKLLDINTNNILEYDALYNPKDVQTQFYKKIFGNDCYITSDDLLKLIEQGLN